MKKRKLDRYVIFSLTALILFTIVIIILITITEKNYDSIITAFFMTFGGELFSCVIIKWLRLKEKKEDE